VNCTHCEQCDCANKEGCAGREDAIPLKLHSIHLSLIKTDDGSGLGACCMLISGP
jgi:hypothetical protein